MKYLDIESWKFELFRKNTELGASYFQIHMVHSESKNFYLIFLYNFIGEEYSSAKDINYPLNLSVHTI